MTDSERIYQESLEYHKLGGKPGKLEVIPTKPCSSQRDLSLAYSPGVAEPCRQIAALNDAVYEYTNKGNLVAVITNGTAVLGLGNIGSLAAKPVMEGKAVLFKRFADIDVFDIEVKTQEPDEFIRIVEEIAPTFGGINLEDIRGPECFYIEKELKKRLDIPVFHDDQHGTAIIAGAGLLNAAELTNRDLSQMRCIFSGAGAAGVSVAKLFLRLGIKRENILMYDSFGLVYKDRAEGMDPYKAEFAAKNNEFSTLKAGLQGADCFIGCSVGNIISPEMLMGMEKNPIVFAMANPTPEIDYLVAKQARGDLIMATGRSDYPNQVNNVLGFPFIFRGALDTAARQINDEMELAAVQALADLAKEDVPESVSRAYGGETFVYGKNYLIPKPFDPRVLYWESVAVAEAAMNSGVARKTIDLEEYRENLRRKVDAGRSLITVPLSIAQDSHNKEGQIRIALPEAQLPKIQNLARRAIEQGIAHPVLVGPRKIIEKAMSDLTHEEYSLLDPQESKHAETLLSIMKQQRSFDKLKDETYQKELSHPIVYATLLVEAGICDGMLVASNRRYGEMVKPVLRYASRRSGVSRIAGVHLMALKDRNLFFADTALITDPSAEELAEIAMRSARMVKRLNIVPRLAFVSYSNFSNRDDPDIAKLRRAHKIVRRVMPDLEVFGDVQLDVALDPERFRDTLDEKLPEDPANILIFPNLHAANAAFRLARVVGQGTAIGPMLLGLKRPCDVMPRGSTEDEILDMFAITAYNAQRRKKDMLVGKKTMTWRS